MTWIASATSYSSQHAPTLPFLIYYSMLLVYPCLPLLSVAEMSVNLSSEILDFHLDMVEFLLKVWLPASNWAADTPVQEVISFSDKMALPDQ